MGAVWRFSHPVAKAIHLGLASPTGQLIYQLYLHRNGVVQLFKPTIADKNRVRAVTPQIKGDISGKLWPSTGAFYWIQLQGDTFRFGLGPTIQRNVVIEFKDPMGPLDIVQIKGNVYCANAASCRRMRTLSTADSGLLFCPLNLTAHNASSTATEEGWTTELDYEQFLIITIAVLGPLTVVLTLVLGGVVAACMLLRCQTRKSKLKLQSQPPVPLVTHMQLPHNPVPCALGSAADISALAAMYSKATRQSLLGMHLESQHSLGVDTIDASLPSCRSCLLSPGPEEVEQVSLHPVTIPPPAIAPTGQHVEAGSTAHLRIATP